MTLIINAVRDKRSRVRHILHSLPKGIGRVFSYRTTCIVYCSSIIQPFIPVHDISGCVVDIELFSLKWSATKPRLESRSWKTRLAFANTTSPIHVVLWSRLAWCWCFDRWTCTVGWSTCAGCRPSFSFWLITKTPSRCVMSVRLWCKTLRLQSV